MIRQSSALFRFPPKNPLSPPPFPHSLKTPNDSSAKRGPAFQAIRPTGSQLAVPPFPFPYSILSPNRKKHNLGPSVFSIFFFCHFGLVQFHFPFFFLPAPFREGKVFGFLIWSSVVASPTKLLGVSLLFLKKIKASPVSFCCFLWGGGLALSHVLCWVERSETRPLPHLRSFSFLFFPFFYAWLATHCPSHSFPSVRQRFDDSRSPPLTQRTFALFSLPPGPQCLAPLFFFFQGSEYSPPPFPPTGL